MAMNGWLYGINRRVVRRVAGYEFAGTTWP